LYYFDNISQNTGLSIAWKWDIIVVKVWKKDRYWCLIVFL